MLHRAGGASHISHTYHAGMDNRLHDGKDIIELNRQILFCLSLYYHHFQFHPSRLIIVPRTLLTLCCHSYNSPTRHNSRLYHDPDIITQSLRPLPPSSLGHRLGTCNYPSPLRHGSVVLPTERRGAQFTLVAATGTTVDGQQMPLAQLQREVGAEGTPQASITLCPRAKAN